MTIASVTEVIEVIGYRRGHPCKWRRLGNLAGSSLTPLFLPILKVAILLGPLSILYSLAPLVLALFSQRLLVASDALHMLLRRV